MKTTTLITKQHFLKYLKRYYKVNIDKKITMFTSSFNGGKYLREAIESVLNQTYENFEYLLFDDGSGDATYEIMKSYKNDSRIKIIKLNKQPNVGVVINKSFDISVGDYWCWCPSDDILCKNLIEKKIEYVNKYPKSVLYNNWFIINEVGDKTGECIVKNMTSNEFSKEVWVSSPIGFTGIMIPSYVYKNMNLYFPNHLNYSEDFYWMIKATIHGIPFDSVPYILHYKRKHSTSLTNKNIQNILKSIPIIRNELLVYKRGIFK